MIYLRQNTAIEVMISKALISSLDGTTPAQSLTIADITAAIYKGATRTALANTGNGEDNEISEKSDGYVSIKLTAGNTGTLGSLLVTLRDDDVFLAASQEFMVIPANVYDSLVATDKELAQQETSDFIKNVLEGDTEIDTTADPWQIVVKNKTTQAELIRKDLKDVNGTGITSIKKIIGQYKEPS